VVASDALSGAAAASTGVTSKRAGSKTAGFREAPGETVEPGWRAIRSSAWSMHDSTASVGPRARAVGRGGRRSDTIVLLPLFLLPLLGIARRTSTDRALRQTHNSHFLRLVHVLLVLPDFLELEDDGAAHAQVAESKRSERRSTPSPPPPPPRRCCPPIAIVDESCAGKS
jgi:hypothetical protein